MEIKFSLTQVITSWFISVALIFLCFLLLFTEDFSRGRFTFTTETVKWFYILCELITLSLFFIHISFVKNQLKINPSFKEDLLIYRPNWLENSNLGIRRILGLLNTVLFIIICISVIWMVISPLSKMYTFLYFENPLTDVTAPILFFSLFWVLWGIFRLIAWLSFGFKQK